jgi:hypothetical protein
MSCFLLEIFSNLPVIASVHALFSLFSSTAHTFFEWPSASEIYQTEREREREREKRSRENKDASTRGAYSGH